ncbi:hypothetical protein CNR22_15560 [Sphingobacteriaceae bacterium]|nr:hypothetical protein CNR22_15560 [Sphingobacteriaceae bacterium]
MKTKVLSLLYTCFVLLTASLLPAQDLHFSQFYENPSLLNPALAGAADPVKAALTYKDQWRSVSAPYKTFGATIETRFNQSNWEQVDKFRSMTFKQKSTSRLAMGFSVYSASAGDGKMGITQGNLTLATFVPISKKSFFSLGLQGSLSQRRLDESKLIFPNQYNGTGYDQNVASQENFSNSNFSYGDVSAGILWSYASEERRLNANKQLKARLGFATYHLNQPKQHFLNSSNLLYRRYVIHGDLLSSFPGSQLAIAPSFLAQFQGSAQEIQAGAMLKYFTNGASKYTGIVKRNVLGCGLYYRNKDAVIVALLLEWQETYAVGLSYDFNVSRLVAASSSRGGFEITLRYTKPKPFLYENKQPVNKEDKK